MDKYNWKKALDFVLYIANQKDVSQAALSENVISLSHFNKMCNGKEKVKAEIVFECAKKMRIEDKKIVEIARNEESVAYLQFKDRLEKLLIIQDYNALYDLKTEIEKYKDKDKYFSQLYYRILGLIEASINKHFEIALYYFKKSLSVVYPKLSFDNELLSLYLNEIDLEIIGSIGLCFKNIEKYEDAITIYLLSLQYLEVKFEGSIFYPKFCYNLARMYEKTNDYDKELRYANIGIEYSKKYQIYSEFGFLYYAKAVAEYYLRIDNEKSFDYCIYHYTLQGRDKDFINSLLKDKENYTRKNRI